MAQDLKPKAPTPSAAPSEPTKKPEGPRTIDYSKLPKHGVKTAEKVNYSEVKAKTPVVPKWKQLMDTRKKAKHQAATNYQYIESSRGTAFVKSEPENGPHARGDLEAADFKRKYPNAGKYHSGGHTRDVALKHAQSLRSSGTHATVWHMGGPKSGPKSSYAISRGPELKKSDMPRPAYGTDISQAEKDLTTYEAKMPRMIQGIQASGKKAPDKKRMLSMINRMHNHFKKGVEYAKHVLQIKQSPTPPSPYFSADNAKLKKDGIISFNLPAGHTCPGKGDCFGFCYALQGPQSWPNAMKKRVDNWGLAERPDFVPRVNEELKKWGKAGGKKTGDIVRVHDSGDFYSQDYIDKWHDIAKSNPDKHFYAYTKALNLDWKKLHALPNFTIVQSVGGSHDHMIDPSLPHSYVFPDEQSMKAAGYTDTHESDLPAAHAKKNPKIGLVIHGAFRKNLSGEYGKEFKDQEPKPEKLASSENEPENKLNKSTSNLGNQVPDVVRFDQPDALSQLSHSPNILDKLLSVHAKGTGEGYHPSHKPEMPVQGQEKSSIRSELDSLKNKFYKGTLQKEMVGGPQAPDSMTKSIDQKMADPERTKSAWGSRPHPENKFPTKPEHIQQSKPLEKTMGTLKKETPMDAAAGSIKNAFGGGTPTPPAPTPAPTTDTGSLAGNITAGINHMLGKTSPPVQPALLKDDKPHTPGSPEATAHDVVERGEAIKHAVASMNSKKKIHEMFQHLRTLRHKADLRSKKNMEAGLEKTDGKTYPAHQPHPGPSEPAWSKNMKPEYKPHTKPESRPPQTPPPAPLDKADQSMGLVVSHKEKGASHHVDGLGQVKHVKAMPDGSHIVQALQGEHAGKHARVFKEENMMPLHQWHTLHKTKWEPWMDF